MCEMKPYEMCISEALCTLNSERISSTFNSYSAGSCFESRPDYFPNFLHRYSDVHFCVYFSLPLWQYFKDRPCGLLKLKALFFVCLFLNYPDRYFPSFLCVFFICILTRISWVSLSLIFTVRLFCVFRNYPHRSSSFLCVFFHLWLKIFTVFVVYDSWTILTEFIYLF
jgi:hypothetical protein